MPFLEQTLPHIVRQHSCEFESKTLIIDDLPLKDGSFPDDQPCWNIFSDFCAALEKHGIFTSRMYLSRVSTDARIIRKHFRRVPGYVRDYRGVPLCGWIAGLECATSTFHVHFDSDVFVYQAPGFDWIAEGMALLRQESEILFVAPHPGPPRRDGVLLDQTEHHCAGPSSNFRFTTFSSRRFLVERRRFESLLPLPLTIASRRIWLQSLFAKRSPLETWESLVSRRMSEAGLYRAHLNTRSAWALHAPDHGSDFIQLLPFLIRSVERGWCPSEQAGRYDLNLGIWKEHAQ